MRYGRVPRAGRSDRYPRAARPGVLSLPLRARLTSRSTRSGCPRRLVQRRAGIRTRVRTAHHVLPPGRGAFGHTDVLGRRPWEGRGTVIASITGEVRFVGATLAVVEVSGFGIEVNASPRTLAGLRVGAT
ncbi:hypothetical protein K1Y78_60875, partial [Streptomyces sp. tea 10]|nr:hypothetical protein [Streptomyces sp. tea 10]